VSRGGRRRKGKRGRKSPVAGERRPGSASEPVEEREGGQPAGRRRGRGSAKEVSVLEQMSSRPAQLTTLPPDGTVLEELIGAMQSEYGVPTTPQEYRLIIKVPAPEEPTDPNLEAKPAAVRPEPEIDSDEEEDGGLRPARSSRRRRRGRRRGGGMAVAEMEIEEEIVLVMDDAGSDASEEDLQQ
jgi:hypothetical protein